MRRVDGLALVIVALILVALAIAATWREIVRAGSSSAAAHGDAIVVFGAGVGPRGPSRELVARLRHAAALFHDGRAPLVICSGGHPGPSSEPRAMSATLRELGVPAEAIELDEQGCSTRATLAGLAGRAERHVLLVSSPFHMHRIGQEARRHGVSAALCPSPSTPVMERRSHRFGHTAREVVATWWYAATASSIQPREERASVPA